MDRKLKVLMYPVYISTNWKIAAMSPPHTKTKCWRGNWDGCQSSVTVPRSFDKSLYCSYTSAIILYYTCILDVHIVLVGAKSRKLIILLTSLPNVIIHLAFCNVI